jgi:Na+-translocating ferredoxin:NAD+ oxidoreductase RnfD subunit
VSSTAIAVPRSPGSTLRRYFRTPKGLLLAVLTVLVVVGAAGEGMTRVAPGLAGALLAAVLVDAPILRLREGEWVFPDGSLITGLIIAMILTPYEPWHLAAVASVIAVVSKYAIRTRSANVFNPAALALVVTFHAFNTGQSWWGALPELPPVALILLFATGVFISARVNKLPVVLAFLGTYYLAITLSAFIGDPARVAELYRAPDLHAALFFAFFMVTDPPTSPPKRRDQVVYGAIVGAASYAVFALVGAAYFLLAGVLVANVWEAWRRKRLASGRARPLNR